MKRFTIHSVMVILLAITLLSVPVSVLHGCASRRGRGKFDFERIQSAARAHMVADLGRDYAGYGYCTLFLGEDDTLSSVAITFHFGRSTAYLVLFDTDGVLKEGGMHSLSFDADSYEAYQNEHGIFVIKGVYGSYLLTEEDSLEYTGIAFEDLSPSDRIGSPAFGREYLLREYGIDVTGLYNNVITEKNAGAS